MRWWGKMLVAAAAPLMLGGCLWGAGKFASDLTLSKGGRFVLDYKGQILLQMPDDGKGVVAWQDGFAICYKDGRATSSLDTAPLAEDDKHPDDAERPCTPAEIARLKAAHDKASAERAESKRKEAEEMAKVFGLPGADDESNRRFAERMMKYDGWRSVRYVGKGVFDVDYHFEGRVGQDYVFPLMPESDLVIPFVTIRRRTDGAVLVSAPAFTGGNGPFGARAKAMGLPAQGGDGPASRAEGRFTVTTDGDILTNNSEDGPAAAKGGRVLHWDVDAKSNRIPETLVRL